MIGAINSINAKSWNLASLVLILNSLFIALALFGIGFILDHDPSINSLNKIFLISTIIVIIGHLFMIFSFNNTINLIKKISKLYFKIELIKKSHSFALNFYKFDYASFIAWFCFLVGFILPSILAVIFNQYRTSLFQTSFIFNSIGTILTIVITDKKASLISDISNPSALQIKSIIDFLSKILINRLISSLFVLIFILLMLFFI